MGLGRRRKGRTVVHERDARALPAVPVIVLLRGKQGHDNDIVATLRMKRCSSLEYSMLVVDGNSR